MFSKHRLFDKENETDRFNRETKSFISNSRPQQNFAKVSSNIQNSSTYYEQIPSKQDETQSNAYEKLPKRREENSHTIYANIPPMKKEKESPKTEVPPSLLTKIFFEEPKLPVPPTGFDDLIESLMEARRYVEALDRLGKLVGKSGEFGFLRLYHYRAMCLKGSFSS